MPAPETPFQPYAHLHKDVQGPGDARPTALQIIKDCGASGKLTNKTILITGCSSGIGVETARALYETGAKLFLTARDVPKLQKVIDDIVNKSESKGLQRPEALELHLDELASVRKAAEDFKKRSSQLNMLINNAGVMACPPSKTKDGLELQIGTNHFAHFLLFQLLKPLLIQSAKESGTTSRVINLSSAGHRFGGVKLDDINLEKDYEKWLSYGQSKTANIYMANSIDRHYGSQNVHGWSVHPGGIMTELGRHLGEDDFKAMGFDNLMESFFKSPEQGAATTVWAAVSPHFEGGNGGRYLAEVGECGPLPQDAGMLSDGYAPHAYNEDAEEKLWKLSCDIVGVPADD
ncbi:NAD(P)-binding protein [Hortaea werneckii]|nr:NAD(P)-binding protein [Hortaea werneckii]KAI7320396.1 NAD(P)-binding protein [Hortaea werneckii]